MRDTFNEVRGMVTNSMFVASACLFMFTLCVMAWFLINTVVRGHVASSRQGNLSSFATASPLLRQRQFAVQRTVGAVALPPAPAPVLKPNV
jgi:hypothetical protein